MDLMRQSAAITVVLALLLLAFWWLKRHGYASVTTRLNPPVSKREIESLQRLILTPNHSVQLIRVQNRLLLIGLHPSGMSLLSEMVPRQAVKGQPQ